MVNTLSIRGGWMRLDRIVNTRDEGHRWGPEVGSDCEQHLLVISAGDRRDGETGGESTGIAVCLSGQVKSHPLIMMDIRTMGKWGEKLFHFLWPGMSLCALERVMT